MHEEIKQKIKKHEEIRMKNKTENELAICKGVVRNGNRTTFDLENYRLSELIPEIVNRFLSLGLSGEVTKATYDEAHSLATDCNYLGMLQDEDAIKDWLVYSLLYDELVPIGELMDAIAKQYPDLPTSALSHIKTLAEVGYAKRTASINTHQLASLISFHLRAALFPLWRNEELNVQLTELAKLKKPPLTLEELTEEVNSLQAEIKKIHRAFNSVSETFSNSRSRNRFDVEDGLPF
jgi:hypothetical protein